MRLTTSCAVFVAAVLATGAFAQDYPSRPLTYVVPFTPGGVTDNGARMIAKVLSEKIAQPVIVENKPGAGGIVGAEYVAQAKPDGYTFMYTSSGPVGAFAYRYKKLSFDPFTAFTPVHGMAFSPMIAVVNANAPYKTFRELIAYAKQKPESINYYSTGPGSSNHLVSELLMRTGGFKMTQVPYKGSSPAMTDLLAGVIQVVWEYPVVLKPLLDAGKIRAIGITSDQRMPLLPEIPTFVEQGFSDAVFTGWAIISVPAGTPQPIVDKLAKAYSSTLDDPTIRKYFHDQGAGILQGYAGEKLRSFIDAENVKYKDLITRAGVEPE
ncbi:tripartite tricarboxylate transporter substrate binding protein [Bradyrhizobium sp. LHD-71]|uniref:Bug family tripartite tricarboxylate transporter substrate binding protein n=1 Tax=Bradyrhizobium sp. LHD-71 TaxID=3072141 RepID=UPI0028109708|nr:tripartite tricarboxylate transporter substrate binding protein [Bradyrhizobium sp. LHD-71]MDQ8726219.1 tripartite tricarboxylate transporter substrate binding protein [Bradyrhizobium sp. LHD-71]